MDFTLNSPLVWNFNDPFPNRDETQKELLEFKQIEELKIYLAVFIS